MATMTRKNRPARPLLFIVGSLVSLVVVVIFLESYGQLENVSPGGVSSETQKKSQGYSVRNPLKGLTNFDVNAPPIPKQISFWDSSVGRDEEDLDQSSFIFWGQQANRLKEFNDAGGAAPKAKKKSKHHKLRPFPVVQDDDDGVPTSAAGSVIRAADALLCRATVIDYVINATDLKDECDGLKKAFTKNCANEEEPALPARRRLARDDEGPKLEQTNPVIWWQHRLYHLSLSLKRFLEPSRPIVMMEDEILKNWNEAKFEVQHNWDSLLEGNEDELARNKRRFLAAMDSIDTPVDKPQVTTTNKTMVSKEKVKPTSLALPTNVHHVSEKMLSETLMLQQEDKIIASLKASQNHTNATVKDAVADAAASAKAVSDIADFVSNVLNDPSSVEARTCCTSILNAFHENCNIDDNDDLSDSRLFIVVAVIALCGLVKSLIHHFHIRWLPEAAGCILVGVFSGWALSYYPHHDISFDGKWFLRIMVPPIVFEAALSIDKRSFNRHIVPIIIYAFVGTLVATGLTAIIVHEGSKYFHEYCETISYIESLAFGALISSIDPIAVLSVLSNMGMTDTDTIYVVIFGESLLNDGVAIVLFQTLEHFLDDNMEVDRAAISAASIHFLVVAVGSLLVGLASGICCTVYYWMMYGCQTPLVEVLMFCCWALLPYYICDGIEWSGIVAVVAAGFVMDTNVVGQHHAEDANELHTREEQVTSSRNPGGRSRERRRRPVFAAEGHLSKEAKTHVGFVTEIISTMMETAIFAYLGLFLFSARYHWNVYHTVIAIGGCCLSRGIMIPLLSTLANSITKIQQVRANCRYQQLPQQQSQDPLATRQKNPAGVIINGKMQLVLWFAGLRGAMSFALVENIPQYDAVTGEGTRFKSELKAMTSACIMFTVFILGGCTFYMTEALGMSPTGSSSTDGNQQNSSEREMELTALIQQKRSEDDNDQSGDIQWEGDQGADTYHQSQAAPRSANVFRQRVQAS